MQTTGDGVLGMISGVCLTLVAVTLAMQDSHQQETSMLGTKAQARVGSSVAYGPDAMIWRTSL